MKSYPLLFSDAIEPCIPDDPSKPITYDPQQWLQSIVDQADRAAAAWQDDWPVSSRAYCGNAGRCAQQAQQALSDGDVGNALLSAYEAGRFIEKAQRDFPIEDWLRGKQRESDKNRAGGKANAEMAQRRRDAIGEWVDQHLDQRVSSKLPSIRDMASRLLKSNSGMVWPDGEPLSNTKVREVISDHLKEKYPS